MDQRDPPIDSWITKNFAVLPMNFQLGAWILLATVGNHGVDKVIEPLLRRVFIQEFLRRFDRRGVETDVVIVLLHSEPVGSPVRVTKILYRPVKISGRRFRGQHHAKVARCMNIFLPICVSNLVGGRRGRQKSGRNQHDHSEI
jgi:hypothetical protein